VFGLEISYWSGQERKSPTKQQAKEIAEFGLGFIPGSGIYEAFEVGGWTGAFMLATELPGAKQIKNICKVANKFSKEKQALVEMAKLDKKKGGISAGDMKAYKELNEGLPDPFPSVKVRGPEVHPNRPIGREPHGHVGPVNHIPIKN